MLALVGVLAGSYVSSARQKAAGYVLLARFNKAEGVTLGTEVRLSGVVVGKIAGQALDDKFRAVLTLRLSPSVKLPTDSSAAIQTDGLLGGKYIALQPGGDETDLKPGGEISPTQDSMAVEDLLEMIIEQAESARGISPQGAAAH
jgi:phospholipid/cholesterol/gamma-HCH transport system substrate-binding protein